MNSSLSDSPATTESLRPQTNNAILEFPRWQIVMLAITISISAFLLFQVQPLVSKRLLPWFGGSPTIWTTAMLFFQTQLFAGYAYAHWATTRLSPFLHLKTHAVLVFFSAMMAFLITPSDVWKPNGDENPTLYVLLLLAISVGIPYFTLASTGPILQAWYSRVQPGASPYRLYALSNSGSFLALLSFPYAFEPYLSISAMSSAWTMMYWAFAFCCIITANGVLNWLSRQTVPAESQTARLTTDGPSAEDLESLRPTSWTRFLWIGLPALASLTMIAVTDHVSHHVAPEPRLWIMTLGLYLLTFIITFDHERWYWRKPMAWGTLLAILVLSSESNLLDWAGIDWGGDAQAIRMSHFLVMFLICFVCHGELVRSRPRSIRYMTEFYLWISAGGACGGLFATLIAVNVFNDYLEWPLCMVLALLVCVAVLFGPGSLAKATPSAKSNQRRFALVGILGIASIAWILFFNDPWGWRSAGNDEYTSRRLHLSRNFYGVVSVEDRIHESDRKRSYRGFYHGSVTHGLQPFASELRLSPRTYYSQESGVGKAIGYLQERQESIRIAVIGLGAGSLAAYVRPTDSITFYEINPEVIRIAGEYFTFLKECNGTVKTVLGDGRLKLEESEEPPFDIIVLDAFTGGSVPIHLLTQEAFAIYRKRLAPRGMIAVHATNSYLNLYPVVKQQAMTLGMDFRCDYMPTDLDAFIRRNFYVIITEDQKYLRRTTNVYPHTYDRDGNELPATEPDLPGVRLWTDQFSSIHQITKK